MMKLSYGPKVTRAMQLAGIDTLKLESPIEETLITVAKALDKRVQDVVVMMLDRPRHKEMVAEIRRVGASLRMISDGDIAAAIGPANPESGIDLYHGHRRFPGSGPGRGGDQMSRRQIMQCKMWPRDEKERDELIAQGHEKDLGRVFFADDLAHGKNIIFCATGISDSALLKGIQTRGPHTITHSILMRAKSKTVRFIRAAHDLQNKTIRLRSDSREHRI